MQVKKTSQVSIQSGCHYWPTSVPFEWCIIGRQLVAHYSRQLSPLMYFGGPDCLGPSLAG